ncbi:MAG: T9SS type A sorting domain-containing protein [Chitinophagaceae bacterium]
MKTFVLYLAATFVIVNAKAQFSENFDAATIASLTANCWVLNGVSTTTTPGEAINNTSILTAPPVNPGIKIDLYTPVLNFATTSTTISFDYRLTQALAGMATRNIQVSLVNLSGTIVATDTIKMANGTNTSVKSYSHLFSPIVAGSYRVAFRLTGANGSGATRLVFDNLVVSNSILVPTGGGCVLAPIADIILPIKLINFDAKYTKPNVTLNWSTAMETNFSHFVIESGSDGVNFNEAAVIFGAGESYDKKDYSFIDKNTTGKGGLVYYRLKSVDIDGQYTYSSVRIIRLDEEKAGISIITYPNPVTNELRVTIPANWQNKKVTYEVYNSNGQVSKKSETANSSQTENVNVNTLAPGFYIVRVTCEGQTAQQKIIKQ